MEKQRFQNQPARYKVGFWQSIFMVWPFDVVTISPTVNLYGSEFGTDKFDTSSSRIYVLQIYNRALAEGAKPEKPAKRLFIGDRGLRRRSTAVDYPRLFEWGSLR